MSSAEVRETIEVQAKALGPLLYTGVATSVASSLTRIQGLKKSKYPHLVPLTMRAEMREYLENNPVPDGWRVGGDSRLMGQLTLDHPDLGMEMRFLKERRRTYPGGVPIAGLNQARRQHWTNLPLDFALPEAVDRVEQGELIRLLLLWDFLDAENSDEFRLRIVHTLAPGVYGHVVPCDLILDVEDGGTIFSHLRFLGSPEDEDFFGVEIAEEEDNGS